MGWKATPGGQALREGRAAAAAGRVSGTRPVENSAFRPGSCEIRQGPTDASLCCCWFALFLQFLTFRLKELVSPASGRVSPLCWARVLENVVSQSYTQLTRVIVSFHIVVKPLNTDSKREQVPKREKS